MEKLKLEYTCQFIFHKIITLLWSVKKLFFVSMFFFKWNKSFSGCMCVHSAGFNFPMLIDESYMPLICSLSLCVCVLSWFPLWLWSVFYRKLHTVYSAETFLPAIYPPPPPHSPPLPRHTDTHTHSLPPPPLFFCFLSFHTHFKGCWMGVWGPAILQVWGY